MNLTIEDENLLFINRLLFLCKSEKLEEFFKNTFPTLESLANDDEATAKMQAVGIPNVTAQIIKRWAVNYYYAWNHRYAELTPDQIVALGAETGAEILHIGVVFQNLYIISKSEVQDLRLGLPFLPEERAQKIIQNAGNMLQKVSEPKPHLHQVTAYIMRDGKMEEVHSEPYDTSIPGAGTQRAINILKQLGLVPEQTPDEEESKE